MDDLKDKIVSASTEAARILINALQKLNERNFGLITWRSCVEQQSDPQIFDVHVISFINHASSLDWQKNVRNEDDPAVD